jgi:hypothetical protein
VEICAEGNVEASRSAHKEGNRLAVGISGAETG